MALAPLDAKAAGEGFGLTNYNKLKADIDYLVAAGADLASAATIVPAAEFHKVTGTTTIDNFNYVGAVAGQQLRLLFASALAIRNNGGGTGNIRTLSGADRGVVANEIVSFVYDGATWRESAGASTPTSKRVYDSGPLGAAAASIDTGALTIPLWAQHLRFMLRGKTDNGAGLGYANGPFLRINNDAASTYRTFYSPSGSASRTDVGGINLNGGAVWTFNTANLANYWTTVTGSFFDAFNTAYEKELQAVLTGAYDGAMNAVGGDPMGGHWPSTAAMNRLAIVLVGAQFIVGSRLMVYADA